MITILTWQVILYETTFGLTHGVFRDFNARFGMIGAMIWGVGGMVFISVMWRLIFPKVNSNNEFKKTD